MAHTQCDPSGNGADAVLVAAESQRDHADVGIRSSARATSLLVGVNGFWPSERSCRSTCEIVISMEDADAAPRPEADPAEEKSLDTAVQVTDHEPVPPENASPPAAEER